MIFTGRARVGGRARGPGIISKKAFTFAHGVEPGTGLVTDVHSDILGSNVKGKVLVYPYGKGSTTASAWFLETVRNGNGPVAVLTGSPDLAAVIGSVMSEILYEKKIPVLCSLGSSIFDVRTGAVLEIDGNKVTSGKAP